MSNQRIEQQLKINKLASDLLKLSRNTLLVNLRFLDAALAQLIPAIRDEGNMGTDGKYFIYNPRYILTQYKQEKEVSARFNRFKNICIPVDADLCRSLSGGEVTEEESWWNISCAGQCYNRTFT